MTGWLHDFNYSLRTLRRSPGFVLAAITAMTIGIGANTAVFSVVDRVLLRPVPYPEPDRLVAFLHTSPGASTSASPAQFDLWRQQTHAFQYVSAYRFGVMNLTGASRSEQLSSGRVSADFFYLFGAGAINGRTFTSNEDQPGSGRVAVLGEEFWRRRFAAAPQIVGASISLDGEPYVVIGVLPATFDATVLRPMAHNPDVWVPLRIERATTDQSSYLGVAGRLRSGITLAAANAELQVAAREFRHKFPNAMGPSGGFSVKSLGDVVVGDTRSSLLVLVAAVGFVFLIACANVANLLLVRGSSRRREIAIRAAVGASRALIVRQLLTESAILSACSGVIGLAVGIFGIRAILAISPGNIPRLGQNAVSVDWRLAAFCLILSLITGVTCGLFPALRVARRDLASELRQDDVRTGSGPRHARARSFLVVVETALTLLLLIGAALLVRTFFALQGVTKGFDSDHVLALEVSLAALHFGQTSRSSQLVRDGVERVTELPTVVSAAAAAFAPFEADWSLRITIAGRPLDGPYHAMAGWRVVSPTYFEVLKIPTIRGRSFTDRDDGDSPNVVVINQSMAHQFWPTADPLNDRLWVGKGAGPEFDEPPRQIVGIVGDVRDGALDKEPRATVYVPMAQLRDDVTALVWRLHPLTWIVRTRVDPRSVRSSIENELWRASGGVPIEGARLMDEITAESTVRQRFNMWVMSIFGYSALLLSAIGLYGFSAFSVQLRRHEIGVRLALGAEGRQVRNLILFESMRIVGLGIIIGVGCAWALARAMSSMLFEVSERDPTIFVLAPAIVLVLAFFATWLPSLSATRVDALGALRSG
jgi:putative ABC transport system permease protein